MKLRKNVVAGILLGIGLPISLLLAVDFSRKDNPNKADDIMAFLVFGFTPTVAGGLLARSLYQEAHQAKLKCEQQERDRLHAIFYQLLKNGKGRITVLPFALETKLSGEDAKRYLDERAKEFDAKYEVDDNGGITYCFDLGEHGSRELVTCIDEASTQEIFDVILEEVPSNWRASLDEAIQALTFLDWFGAVDLVRSLDSGPKPVKKKVDKAVAEFIQQKLEKAGAKATIKPSADSPRRTNPIVKVSSQEKYDVILEAVSPNGNSIQMAQIIGVLIDQHWFKTSDLIKSLESGPKPIKKQVDKAVAQFMKQQLEKAGMEVTLKPSE